MEKVARLSIPRGISVRTALVYEGRLLPIVKANAYFDALVDISSLISGGLLALRYRTSIKIWQILLDRHGWKFADADE